MPIIPIMSERTFEDCPEGLHQAVCVDVVNLGELTKPWSEVPKPYVKIVYQVDVEETRYQESTRDLNLTANSKGKLSELVSAWRGKQMSEEELAGFDLEQLIGKNCQLQIVHAPRDNGGVFCNIQAIVPAPKGVIKLRAADDYVRVQDRPTRNGNGHTATAAVPDDDEVPF